MQPTRDCRELAWRDGLSRAASRSLAEELAVAITYNRETHAVMMATPDALEDFAVGFSLSEGVVDRAEDITDLAVVEAEGGVELRMDLSPDRLEAARRRRRRLAGPTGCGLCGIDSLAEAVRPPRSVTATLSVTPDDILEGIASMAPLQMLGATTRATHAAAFWRAGQIRAVREDVGRHNALDKLVGALARAGDGCCGMVLLSSRVSIEMVQKACVLGAPVLVAVSAPTAHAVRLAEQAGLTLVAVARTDGFEVFCHPHRIRMGDNAVQSPRLSGNDRSSAAQPPA